ncbi:MAG: DUF2493 domain-containing protein [Ruminococcus sp.]|nr:DUF2493 domain-containing protein [Ruminococcus sp.]
MVKRVVVAGCRNYTDFDEAKKYIDYCLSEVKKSHEIIIVSGGCKGADMLGERYAREQNLQIERYCAQWDLYGKSAGPKRNLEMAKVCDYVICFWDSKSKGTASMIKCAKELDKPVRIKWIQN